MLLERNSKGAVQAANDDGTFTAILATEGEASDGHIISMRGLQTHPSMPMLFGHYSSEQIPLVGSVRKPTKSYRGEVPTLRVEGGINLNGDGILAEVRRGLHQLVIDGDLNAMSIRIDVQKTTPRRNLAKDHPAFIDAAKVGSDDPRYFGVYIERSDAKEGSLVAIGADPAALIGRSEAMQNEHVRTFFRALASNVEGDSEGLGDLSAGFAALRDAIDDVRSLGVDDGELAEYLAGDETRDYTTVSVPSNDGESLEAVRVRRDVFDVLTGESQSTYRSAVVALHELEREREQIEEQRRKLAREKVPTPPPVNETAVAEKVVRMLAQPMAKAAADAVSESIGHQLGRVKR